ncbi:hypothetical protein [Thalassococcus sp. S3]|uniref:hypothetical protein n=1 Tax=Thalassococcus sp. S3 TaxID=2017482 RepID=UPI00102B80C6|nr:hypothetical protein [Thalassococcus sp. S3]
MRYASGNIYDFLSLIYGKPKEDGKLTAYFTLRSFRVSFIIAFSYIAILPLAPTVGVIITASVFSMPDDLPKVMRASIFILYPFMLLFILYVIALTFRTLIRNIDSKSELLWRNQIVNIEATLLGLPMKFTILAFTALIIFATTLGESLGSIIESSTVISAFGMIFVVLTAAGFGLLVVIGALRVLYSYGVASFALLPFVLFLGYGRYSHYILIFLSAIISISYTFPNAVIPLAGDDLHLSKLVSDIIDESPFTFTWSSGYVFFLSILTLSLLIYPFFSKRSFLNISHRVILRYFLATSIFAVSVYTDSLGALGISGPLAYGLTMVAFIMANAVGDNISVAVSRHIFWKISLDKNILLLPLRIIFDLLGVIFSICASIFTIWIAMLSIIVISGSHELLLNPSFYLRADQLEVAQWYTYVYWGSSILMHGLLALVLVAFGESALSAAYQVGFFPEIVSSGILNSTDIGLIIGPAVGVLFGFFTAILPSLINAFFIVFFIFIWLTGSIGQRVAVIVGRFVVCEDISSSERQDRIETVMVAISLLVSISILSFVLPIIM